MAGNPVGTKRRAQLTKRNGFLFQGIAHMVVRTLRAARLILHGVLNGGKRPASKLVQGAATDPVTLGYLRGGVAAKQVKHCLGTEALRRR